MRWLLSELLRPRTKSSSSFRTSSRRPQLGVESLEERQLLSGSPLGDVPLTAPPTAGSGSTALTGINVNLKNLVLNPGNLSKSATDAQMGLPMLDSNPGAKATIYLDFTGSFVTDWWTKNGGDWSKNSDGSYKHFNITTPAFDTDGDPTTFSADEKALIKQIWARVAEDYAPFNINVSTDYYGSFNNGQAVHVAIGGWNDWAGGSGSGISSIGSFSDDAPNTVFVFSNDIVFWHNHNDTDGLGRVIDIAAATATTASHESGHTFGLYHQSRYDVEGNKLQEYDPGSGSWAPIMGDNLSSALRTTWDYGENDMGHLQDDMAVIAGSANGFGYRADDHGDTIATADPLKVPIYYGGALTGKGIINSTYDVDVFSFTTSGGAVKVDVKAAPNGPNLIPIAQLWSANGYVAAANAGSMTESIINTNVAAGTYYVFVRSLGDYGDVGQYTVAVTLGSGPVMTALRVNSGGGTGVGTTVGSGNGTGNTVVNRLVALNQAPASGIGGGLTTLQTGRLFGAGQVAALTNPSPLAVFAGTSTPTGSKGTKKGTALGGLPGNGLIQTLGIG